MLLGRGGAPRARPETTTANQEAVMRAAPARPALTLLAVASAALAVAAAYEGPRTFQAAEILKPSQVKGPHFSLAPTVKTEGYLHIFDITTDYGPLEAEGLSMLLVRLSEVRALAELDQVSKSEVFLKSAGTSVVNVGKGAASAVKDPGATAKGIGGGLKRFGTNLGRTAKQTTDKVADDASKKDENKAGGPEASTGDKAAQAANGVAGSILGINGAARKWAQKVGVDPYTTNPVLKEALSDLGKVDAAGSIAAKVVVPIPMVVSSTATVGNLVWAKDPQALLKENEQALRALGVSDGVIKRLYLSKGFTLTLHTRLVQALSAVKAKGSADYVAAAAESDTEREAAFFVESAELLARFHKTAPAAAVLPDSRALVAKTGDGRAVALLPLDWVQWTQASEKALDEVAKRAKAELGATKLEMQLTGRLSEVAKKETAARGWAVVENVPSTFEVAQARAAAAPKK
jgi:hypothetical protein